MTEELKLLEKVRAEQGCAESVETATLLCDASFTNALLSGSVTGLEKCTQDLKRIYALATEADRSKILSLQHDFELATQVINEACIAVFSYYMETMGKLAVGVDEIALSLSNGIVGYLNSGDTLTELVTAGLKEAAAKCKTSA